MGLNDRARLPLGLQDLLNCFLYTLFVLEMVTFSPLSFTPVVTQEDHRWPLSSIHILFLQVRM